MQAEKGVVDQRGQAGFEESAGQSWGWNHLHLILWFVVQISWVFDTPVRVLVIWKALLTRTRRFTQALGSFVLTIWEENHFRLLQRLKREAIFFPGFHTLLNESPRCLWSFQHRCSGSAGRSQCVSVKPGRESHKLIVLTECLCGVGWRMLGGYLHH